MALAALFLIFENLRTGAHFLWLSFGGAAAGVLGLLDVPVAGQIAVFIIFSGILIVFEKRFFDRYRFKKPDEMKLGDDYGANAAALQRSDSDEPYENVFRNLPQR